MRNAIIFLDSGDTLVDESTEVRIKGDVVDHAEFFPGIKEVLFQLKNAGFRVALVADGLGISFLYAPVVERELQQGTLARFDLAGLPMEGAFWFVCLKDNLFAKSWADWMQ